MLVASKEDVGPDSMMGSDSQKMEWNLKSLTPALVEECAVFQSYTAIALSQTKYQ